MNASFSGMHYEEDIMRVHYEQGSVRGCIIKASI